MCGLRLRVQPSVQCAETAERWCLSDTCPQAPTGELLPTRAYLPARPQPVHLLHRGACSAADWPEGFYIPPQQATQGRHTEPDCLLHAGDQYEAVLNSKLTDLGIDFWTEASLRQQGYFKTPDALLQVDHRPDSVDCMH